MQLSQISEVASRAAGGLQSKVWVRRYTQDGFTASSRAIKRDASLSTSQTPGQNASFTCQPSISSISYVNPGMKSKFCFDHRQKPDLGTFWLSHPKHVQVHQLTATLRSNGQCYWKQSFSVRKKKKKERITLVFKVFLLRGLFWFFSFIQILTKKLNFLSFLCFFLNETPPEPIHEQTIA